jgi:tetratricopeptide (TPR) repeat protein
VVKDPKRLSLEYSDLARVNHERGQDQRAIALLEDALTLDPANTAARETLGRIYLKRGEAPEAITVLAPIERESRDADALVLLGDAYERGSRLSDAQRVYASAVALDPKNARARVGLGWIQVRTRNPKAGIAQIEKGVDLAPGDVYSRVTLADALALDNRIPRAEREYERALRDNPADARSHAHYAAFLASQGRNAEARKSYEKALAQDPDAPGVADELARLGQRHAKFDSVWEGMLLMPILPFLGISSLLAKLAE